jgi:hypothetical protein
VGNRLVRLCNSERTVHAKAFLTFIRETVPAPNVIAADVFRTDTFP